MSKEVLLEYMKWEDKQKKTEFHMVLLGALVLKKQKESCIIMIPLEETAFVIRLFQEAQIQYKILHKGEKKAIVLFYRVQMLREVLKLKESREFLEEYGYAEGDIQVSLDRLAQRAALYYKRDGSFPHEIGVFLGYPIEDIRGFIRYEGKKFLLSGYWKVYGNAEEARARFRLFDETKETVVAQWMSGKKLFEIAG